MLSNNPALASPPLELPAPSRSVPAQTFQPQVDIPENRHASPRQQLEGHTSTPGTPSRLSQQRPQHGVNGPHPSLSPLSEYHSGFADEDHGPPYPSPSPFSLASHRRQHSFPNLLPLAFSSRTPSPTRKTHARSPSEQMPYTGDGRGSGRAAAGSPLGGGGGGLASWFGGGKDGAAPPDTTPVRLRRGTTGPGSAASDVATPKSTMTTASRFMSAISSRFNPTTPTTPALDTDGNDDDDELCSLNIEAALFPRGSPTADRDRDAFSPAAFKNLHTNAVGLLGRMQTAYRERVTALRELEAERSVQRDELEEAETRARHLKMQLEGMARKAQEHERAMQALAEELAAERRARARAEQRAAAAAASAAAGGGSGGMVAAPPEEGASIVSEDLGVDEDRLRRRKRRSQRKSWKSGSGGDVSCGEDSDEDEENESAESESVFSRCRSPALSHAPLQQQQQQLHHQNQQPPLGPVPAAALAAAVAPRQRPTQQMSALQRIFKGISGDQGEDPGAPQGCANCKGQDASIAWDTVSLLRDENRHLKRRVGELEVAVEGALDLVNGIGL